MRTTPQHLSARCTQGTYLAHLTEMTRLCTIFEQLTPMMARRLNAETRVLRLGEYLYNTRVLEFMLASAVKLHVASYHPATSDILTVFHAKRGTMKTSVTLSGGGGLSGRNLSFAVHSLTVQLEIASAGTDVRCPASCLLDWMAQSRVQSVALQIVHGGHGGGRVILKASVADDDGQYGSTQCQAHVSHLIRDFERLCPRYELSLVRSIGYIRLSNLEDTSL